MLSCDHFKEKEEETYTKWKQAKGPMAVHQPKPSSNRLLTYMAPQSSVCFLVLQDILSLLHLLRHACIKHTYQCIQGWCTYIYKLITLVFIIVTLYIHVKVVIFSCRVLYAMWWEFTCGWSLIRELHFSMHSPTCPLHWISTMMSIV